MNWIPSGPGVVAGFRVEVSLGKVGCVVRAASVAEGRSSKGPERLRRAVSQAAEAFHKVSGGSVCYLYRFRVAHRKQPIDGGFRPTCRAIGHGSATTYSSDSGA